MLRMKSGESVADYFSRTMGIVNKIRIHGDKIEDVTIIEKILRSMTPKFNFVVCSIEESKDIDELSIEELQGSLQVHEQKITQQEKEEQALKPSTDNHSSTPNRGRGRGRLNQDRKNLHQTSENYQFHDFQGRGRGRGGYHSTANKPKSGDKYNVECFKCHRYGHYRSECRTNLNKNRGEKSNFVEKEEEVSLLMTIPANFDGENEKETQQPHQQKVPAVSPAAATSPAATTSPATAEHNEQDDAIASSHPQRVRRRPGWMQDYEIMC
ncbi:hypothetical protein F0562_028399 [Nyssa sinensis]|uniref:CCHC-type domain-containing protein n=1 Tax=Nyssa sinensis TaxID=561372 RepID=A0A5J5B479_9ASTE|nr:hypothetical protein F0562_028399 [Nyssa sinensis]